MCGIQMLFSFREIGIHINKAHKMRLRDFKATYFGIDNMSESIDLLKKITLRSPVKLPQRNNPLHSDEGGKNTKKQQDTEELQKKSRPAKRRKLARKQKINTHENGHRLELAY
jgi:hypothetical protein